LNQARPGRRERSGQKALARLRTTSGAAFSRSRRHRRVLGSPHGYPNSALETVLGLIGMVIYIVAVISLAAGVTYLIVRISPSNSKKKGQTKPKPAG
jgi:hypothetical protein